MQHFLMKKLFLQNGYAFHLPDPIEFHSRSRQLRGRYSRMDLILLHLILTFFPNYNMSYSYGGERYEKRDLQIRVRKRFAELQALDEEQGRVPWHVVDASQSIEEVTKELVTIVNETVERVGRETSPLRRMWEEGEYELPEVKGKEQCEDKTEEKKEN